MSEKKPCCQQNAFFATIALSEGAQMRSNHQTRVFQTGPSAPLGATEQFSGGNEQRPSLDNFAVTLHNPSKTIY